MIPGSEPRGLVMAVVDMNDSGSRAQGFKRYEQLRAVNDLNYSGSWALGFRCYEP